MNPICPNCQNELHDDFGLVDCKSCGAVCLIDLNDNVTVQGDEPESPQPEEGSLEPHEEFVDEADEEIFEDVEEYEEESQQEQEEQLEEVEVETETEEAFDQVEEVREESGQTSEPDQESVSESTFEPVLSGEDFLKDLETFSEEAAPDGGHIYYDFHVEGLESEELKALFAESLADSRLEISEDYVKEQISEEGDFSLAQVSFLRLSVIYKRLLFLGLEMSWSRSEVQEPASYLLESYAESEEQGEYEDQYENQYEDQDHEDDDEIVYEEES